MSEAGVGKALIVSSEAWVAATSWLAERSLTERSAHRTYEQLRLWGGRDLRVEPETRGYYQTITDALVDARDGDHIMVAPGEYEESLTVAKDVVIEGEPRRRFDGLAGLSDPATVILGFGAPAIVVLGGAPELMNLGLSGDGETPPLSYDRTYRPPASLALMASQAVVSAVRIDGGGVVIDGGKPILSQCDIGPINKSAVGLFLVGGTRATIDECVVHDCIGGGIEIEGRGTSATVSGTEVYGCRWDGIWVRDEACAVLTDNHISSNAQSGVVLGGGSGSVRHNHFAWNARGIRISSGKARLLDNQFFENAYGDVQDDRRIR